jgi:His-Xaa-Ser system protein HxsD
MSLESARTEFDTTHTTAKFPVSKNVFSKAAVLRACYWFSRDLWCRVDDEAEELWITVGVRVTSPTLEHPKVKKIDDWLPDIFNSLVDAQLRVEIQGETSGIRELIIAKAFAESGVLEDLPPGTFRDPVDPSPSESSGFINIKTEKRK